MKIKLWKNCTQTNRTTESKIHIDQMLRLWDISIYVRLLVGNKSIWSRYDWKTRAHSIIARRRIMIKKVKTNVIT